MSRRGIDDEKARGISYRLINRRDLRLPREHLERQNATEGCIASKWFHHSAPWLFSITGDAGNKEPIPRMPEAQASRLES